MSNETQHWAICPVEECEYAQEYDPSASAYCPECGMELIFECPACHTPVLSESQTTCSNCGVAFKE